MLLLLLILSQAGCIESEGKVEQQERAGLRKCPEAFQSAQERKKEEQLDICAQPLIPG